MRVYSLAQGNLVSRFGNSDESLLKLREDVMVLS